jgi:hypothetical protein
MGLRRAVLAGAGLVAAVAMGASAATLADLGTAVGWAEPLHWALPVSVDLLALVSGLAWLAASVPEPARKMGAVLTLITVTVSVVLNAVGHLVDTNHLMVGPWMVISVSAVPPLAAALAVHLAANITTAPATAADRRAVICARGGLLAVPKVPALPRPKAEKSEAKRPAARRPAKPKTPPRRSDAEVLAEARTVTAGWEPEQLTADRLRAELRISPERARAVRETLRAERLAKADTSTPTLVGAGVGS